MVEKYDLLIFSESKISEIDIISFSGYCSLSQPRKQTHIRRSGGISVYFKEELSKSINKIDTESDYILWLEIDKTICSTDQNIIIGAVYIPPENSNYFNDDEFSNLEAEIMSVCSSHKYVLLAGDFNARTSELRDFTENDEFLADIFDFDSETCNFFS